METSIKGKEKEKEKKKDMLRMESFHLEMNDNQLKVYWENSAMLIQSKSGERKVVQQKLIIF